MSHAEIEPDVIEVIFEEPDPSALWRKEINRHIGQRIRARRKQLRMSQTVLGQQVGLTFQQVQKYEYGSNRISAARLFDIARVLSVHPMSFVFGFREGPAEWADINSATRQSVAEIVNEAIGKLRAIGGGDLDRDVSACLQNLGVEHG